MLYNKLNKKLDNLTTNIILDYKNGDKKYYKNKFNDVFNDITDIDSLKPIRCDFCKRIDKQNYPMLTKYKNEYYQLCNNCYSLYFKIISKSALIINIIIVALVLLLLLKF
jgi:hypothetical protein